MNDPLLSTDLRLARFDPYYSNSMGERVPADMREDSDGDWVRYEDFERLEDALKDILMGANMMLDGPCPASLKRYAEEVRRVTRIALGRDKTALKGVAP